LYTFEDESKQVYMLL